MSKFLLLQKPFFAQSQSTNSLIWNEAFSNYVVFLLGIIVGVLGWWISSYLSRKRPNIIKVIKKEQVSLLSIDSSVEKDLELIFKGSLIDSLHRTALDLLNQGDRPINDFTFTIQTDNANLRDEILDNFIVDSSETKIHDSEINLSEKNIEITINFLNPSRQYRDRLRLYIFSSIPITIKDARGRGPGWGAAYIDQIEQKERIDRVFNKLLKTYNPFDIVYGIVELLVILTRRFQ